MARIKRQRLIARLDVKNEWVIKGIHLEGLRKVGKPLEMANHYYREGVDEIIFMDAVASLYGRNNLFQTIEKACEQIFVPITIGGGIRSLKDIELALKSGADKIAINTQAIKQPDLIREAALTYGSQCIVGSIEAKRKGNSWEAYVDNGRESTGLDAIEWAKKLEGLGAGEIMVTSIDHEGTKRGFDKILSDTILSVVSGPVILSGGAWKSDHFLEINKDYPPDGLAVASILHYHHKSVSEIKSCLTNSISKLEL